MRIDCPLCNRTIREGEMVRARVVACYKELASRTAYAISQPTECESVQHYDCYQDNRFRDEDAN